MLHVLALLLLLLLLLQPPLLHLWFCLALSFLGLLRVARLLVLSLPGTTALPISTAFFSSSSSSSLSRSKSEGT